VENLLSSIDWEHMDTITDLHFVRVVVDFSPHLNQLSSQVSDRFRTTLARKTRLQPLSTIGSVQTASSKSRTRAIRPVSSTTTNRWE
jgi:hypothetical protein